MQFSFISGLFAVLACISSYPAPSAGRRQKGLGMRLCIHGAENIESCHQFISMYSDGCSIFCITTQHFIIYSASINHQ